MAVQIHYQVQQSLLRELNLVTRFYFHQTVDDILTELRCQSNSFEHSSQPDSILKTIYHSGILYQRSDKIVSRLRNAIARYVHGSLGVCQFCGITIPPGQLMENPTSDACLKCVAEQYKMVYEKGFFY